MKKFYIILVIGCLIALESTVLKASIQPGGRVTFQVFYDNLSPYGQWIEDTEYGYVWVPSVGADFRPYYSDGYWVMTDYGNMWVSDYTWGWATFHYGRWTFDSDYGWIWIPDTEWGPAWVSWRSNSDYYGWAPLGPGVSVSMSFESYNPPDDWWIFISPAYMYQPQWHEHFRGYEDNRRVLRNTVVIRNTFTENKRTYVAGPGAEEVRRVVHRDIPVYKVQDNGKPGRAAVQNNAVSIYRPAVERSDRVAPPNAKKAERPIGKLQAAGSRNQVQQGQNQQNVPVQPRTQPDNKTTQQPPAKEQSGKQQEQPNRAERKNDKMHSSDNNRSTQPERKAPESRKTTEQPKNQPKPETNKQPQQSQPQPPKSVHPENQGQNAHPGNSTPAKRETEQRVPERHTDNPKQNQQSHQQQPQQSIVKQPPKPQVQEKPPQPEPKPQEQPQNQEKKER